MSEALKPGLSIRPAVEADARAIVSLHFASVHHFATGFYPQHILDLWSSPPDERRWDRMRRAIASEAEAVVVAECSGMICGFGSVVAAEEELRSLYVDPGFARRGVGSVLLAHLESVALAHGLRQLHLNASLNAVPFYRTHGFEVVRPGVHHLSGGIDMACVAMRKTLSAPAT